MKLVLVFLSLFVLASGLSLARPPLEAIYVPHEKLCPKSGKGENIPTVFPGPRREAISCEKDRKVLGCLTHDSVFVKLNTTKDHWIAPDFGFTYKCIGNQKMAVVGRTNCLMGESGHRAAQNFWVRMRGAICYCDLNKPEAPDCQAIVEEPDFITFSPVNRLIQKKPKGFPRPVRRSVPRRPTFPGKLRAVNPVLGFKPVQPVAQKAVEPVVVSRKNVEKGSIQFNFIFTD